MDTTHSTGGRPLMAEAVRPWAGGLMAGCVVLVAALGAAFAHQTKADALDRAIDAPVITWSIHHPGQAGWLARPGSLLPMAVLSVAIGVACLLAGRMNGAVLAVTAVPVATGLNDGLLKHLVNRTYLGVLSYPSGHTASAFALAGAVAVLLLASPGGRVQPLRVLLAVATGALGILVAVGVMGLEWHYFTDTVGGAALGVGMACGLAFVLDLPVVARQLARVSLWHPVAVTRQ
jgi:membrane-associated phospholipid phosphatase